MISSYWPIGRGGLFDWQEQALIDHAAELSSWLTWARYTYPLSAEVLWVNEAAPWDQRRAVAIFTEKVHAALIRGGNRSGKTYGMKQLCVAMACGGDHPMVKTWLADNSLPANLIPDGPATCVMVAQSAADSVRYHRDDIARMLPSEGVKWYNKNAPFEARVYIEVPGYTQPAVIYFKSTDQGHRKFKGMEARFIDIDEEPEGSEGQLVFEECLRATSGTGGWVALSMTPQSGQTWVYKDLEEKQKHNAVVVELDALDNPLVKDRESLARWIEGLDEDEQAMRRFGKFVDRRGLVYPHWFRGTGDRFGPGHYCEPFEIPKEWPRFSAADFGLVAPTAVGWAALGDDHTLYVYRLYYKAGLTYEQHGLRIHEEQGDLCNPDGTVIEYGEAIECAWGDPGDTGGEAMETWARMDLYYTPANKTIKQGIDEVNNRLRVRQDGRPRIKFFLGMPGLPEVSKEIENYRWNPKMVVPTPIKKHDHAMDMLRYLCMGVRDWLGDLS